MVCGLLNHPVTVTVWMTPLAHHIKTYDEGKSENIVNVKIIKIVIRPLQSTINKLSPIVVIELCNVKVSTHRQTEKEQCPKRNEGDCPIPPNSTLI